MEVAGFVFDARNEMGSIQSYQKVCFATGICKVHARRLKYSAWCGLSQMIEPCGNLQGKWLIDQNVTWTRNSTHRSFADIIPSSSATHGLVERVWACCGVDRLTDTVKMKRFLKKPGTEESVKIRPLEGPFVNAETLETPYYQTIVVICVELSVSSLLLPVCVSKTRSEIERWRIRHGIGACGRLIV